MSTLRTLKHGNGLRVRVFDLDQKKNEIRGRDWQNKQRNNKGEVLIHVFPVFTQNTEEKMEKCASFGDLFFILYSITDRFSFVEAKRLCKYVRRVKNNECVVVLVGTKKDLKRHRRVRKSEGLGLAKEMRSVFCEISISEGFVETNSLLNDSLRLHLNKKTGQENADKEKVNPLSRMKEGFRGIYARRKSCSV